MVGTILPIVHGDSRKTYRALAVHSLGYVVGAIVVGTTLAILGRLVPSRLLGMREFWPMTVIGLVSLSYGLRELGVTFLPLPQSHWRVPRSWRNRFSIVSMSFLYGLVLGLGMFTPLTASTFHVVALWAFMSREPLWAGAAMSLFGLGRAFPLVWASLQSQTLEQSCEVATSIQHRMTLMRSTNSMLLAFSGSYFLSVVVIRLGEMPK